MDYLILSAAILAIGIYGLLSKSHLLKVLISLELIATAATMNFVMLSMASNTLGEAFLMLAFSTDTCITAIVLAIMFINFKKYGSCDLRKIAKMEQASENKDSGYKEG